MKNFHQENKPYFGLSKIENGSFCISLSEINIS